MSHWEHGDAILMRHVHQGVVLRAVPVRVVQDDDKGLVVWVAPGSEQFYPFGRADDGRLLPLAQWRFEVCTWWGSGMIELTPPNRHHALRLHWDEHGDFAGWYVNLQKQIRRHKLGYDTMDWQLDIWVTPDGSASWKDEDDIDVAIKDGLLSHAEVEQARTEGESVMKESPWPTGWENWQAPNEWTALPLPKGWDNS